MKYFICIAFALVACRPPAPEAPDNVEESTYKLFTPEGQCTAWAVDERHAITAGHCCDAEGAYFLHQVRRPWIMAHVVAASLIDFVAQDPVDVCLLGAEGLAAPLVLADRMPRLGDHVGYVGYPAGEWAHETGAYVGDTDGLANWNNYASTAPCAGGASGSAMYFSGGVYGVLVRKQIVGGDVLPGEMGCVASPLEQILEILKYR